MTPSTAEPLTPGLLVLHGNRLEDLAATVFEWLATHPLAPLEEETLLVQSNGMAEWLKMELAAAHGVCAATQVELPARFLWRTWRAVLGRDAVPAVSPLGKLPLTWRLMALLRRLVDAPASAKAFAPVAGFLAGGAHAVNGAVHADAAAAADANPAKSESRGPDPIRRLQLAQRIADLFDQYQVYRSDWLHDWQQGADVLRPADGATAGAQPVDARERWQPALWRAVVESLPAAEREAIRPALHERFVATLAAAAAAGSAPPGLPRRVVLFGTTHVPPQVLETLAALSRFTQVLLAVPNPCRHYWADLVEGNEFLTAARRRHGWRRGRDRTGLAPEALHAHGHPLLAAWGRQSRDFIRQLDAYDDVQRARERFALPRVDLFDEEPGRTLLQQVQARIRDLVPLAEHDSAKAAAALGPSDRSIVFHLAHSPQREVEILHDQLLELLARPPERDSRGALAPRDIVVMVPDIAAFAPAIRSVFGQHAASDPRHIPWRIADLGERDHNPLLAALAWVLRAPEQRFTTTELLGVLEVPAVARRFGLAETDRPQLQAWIAEAGVRWGLDAAHRGSLGLAACGDTHTWAFGLARMLMGFAVGSPAIGAAGGPPAAAEGIGSGIGSGIGASHGGGSGTAGDAFPGADAHPAAARLAAIEPLAEVGGLAAGVVGGLAELLEVLAAWWRDARQPCPPAAWGERLRALLAALVDPADPRERATLAALTEALAAWLQACDAAGFEEPLPLAVVAQAWLEGVDEPALARRFRGGGVTFCTLLPLRAVPFEVVCLLGMNDGDYPRRGARSDFDLMARPEAARPGDRSRRDDDRQLMLDALLSARRVLYVSWCGRSQRDNSAQPPSVLVAQLRDYLAAGWSKEIVEARTTGHPLQPFSRAYFEAGPEEPAGPQGNAGGACSPTPPSGARSSRRRARTSPARRAKPAPPKPRRR